MFRFRKTTTVLAGIALLTHLWLGCDCHHSHAAEGLVCVDQHEHSATDHHHSASLEEDIVSSEYCQPLDPEHHCCNCKGSCQYLSSSPVKTPLPEINGLVLEVGRLNHGVQESPIRLFLEHGDTRLNQFAAAAARTYLLVETWRI